MGILTIVFAVVTLWSLLVGARVGFATQLGMVILQAGYLVSAVVAVWLAWKWMNVVSNRIAGWHQTSSSAWVNHMVSLWHQAPQVGKVIAFIVFYVLVSSILHAVIRPIAAVARRAVPGLIAKNHLLGAGLGLVAGAIRSLFLGALVFAALHFFAWPWLSQAATGSKPYQYAVTKLYKPYLSPVLDNQLPVFGKDAEQAVAKNISLFVIPTPSATERGILVVPTQISTLAKQITAGQHTDRAKAYALYEWEIHHIKYNWKKYQDYVTKGQWDAQTPLQTLQTGEGVCADYALLYAEMAHAVGLTVQIDEGMGGTPTDEGSHAWNEVWDSSAKRWIPVDTTWGASQDMWFDAPAFSLTHHLQKSILIEGTSH
ncbi:hypothetical protein AN477_23420 [Alicyclobacillus ferrooxydans]|uniref:Transglutaminase-like domain-containing protein n=1 Tax=Alicyclobacillus ferrooxydans TaxID=471514 RepID=A0A0P9EKA1_9BACL|nr:hypothetical protein AN477_23420 [Alicyclobacillus ferrooxydans]